VAGPTLSIWLINRQAVETSAGIRLERVHDSLGADGRFHYYVNVIGSHVGGEESPALVPACLADGSENY
jgi:hypothetical protein